MKKIVIVFAMAAALVACRKEANQPTPAAETAAAKHQPPKGFKVLTPDDLRAMLRKQGMLPAQVEFVVASTKFTIRPEEQGQTAAELNAKLDKALKGNPEGPTPDNYTSYVIPNILSVGVAQNSYVEPVYNLEPADSSVANWGPGFPPIISVTQRFRFSGKHWYHNQAPGGCTWGYFTHSSDMLYIKSNNGVAATNINFSSQATFCPRPNNNACYHQVLLYGWMGTAWQLMYNVTQFINPNVPGAAFWTQINPQWGLGPGLYSVCVAVYSNGWDAPGWPQWRTQYVQFVPKW